MYTQPIPLKKNRALFVSRFEGELAPTQNLPIITSSPIKKYIDLPTVIEEADKDFYKQKAFQNAMLNDVLNSSKTVLFKAKTKIPFDMFPNDIIVDLTKVTLVTRNFFMSGQTQSIYIKDIMDAMVEIGPFFSTLRIVDSGFAEDKISIKFLSRKDALRARQVIQGLIAACKTGIDMTKISGSEILKNFSKLAKFASTPVSRAISR